MNIAMQAGKVASLLVCIALFFFASSPIRRTASGVQCPTANVQLVRTPIIGACGHVMGYEMRAPKPGDPGFLQCRCAEKQSGSIQLDIQIKPQLFPARPPVTPDLYVAVKPTVSLHWHIRSPEAPSFPPPVPPPLAA